MADFYHWRGENLVLRCHVQPGAKINAFCGRHGDRLKLRINAPAVDGKANEGLIGFLAERFGVSKSAVQVVAGAQSRQKTLSIAAPRRFPEEVGIEAQA